MKTKLLKRLRKLAYKEIWVAQTKKGFAVMYGKYIYEEDCGNFSHACRICDKTRRSFITSWVNNKRLSKSKRRY